MDQRKIENSKNGYNWHHFKNIHYEIASSKFPDEIFNSGLYDFRRVKKIKSSYEISIHLYNKLEDIFNMQESINDQKGINEEKSGNNLKKDIIFQIYKRNG